MKRILRIASASAVLAMAVFIAPAVGARSAQADQVQPVKATVGQQTATTAKQNAQQTAQANKQRVCEQKQAKLQERLNVVARQGSSQLGVFDKISTLVQNYKTTKNLTVANYDQLVAAVTAARAQAVTAMNAADTAPKIDCTAGDPKAPLTAFQNAVKTRNQAMKNYQTAIRNLLVAVKTAQNQSTQTTTTTTKTGGAQ